MRILFRVLVFSGLMALSPIQNAIESSDVELLSLNCNGCHGPGGVSSGTNIPSIAGLEFRYFIRTMLRFRKKERTATIMDRIARGYQFSELRNIARYFAALEWENATSDPDEEKVRKGHDIHHEWCEECHEKNGRHQDKDIPRISGQQPGYLYLQMLDYQAGRETMPQPDKMKERMKALEPRDIEALSHFYASGL